MPEAGRRRRAPPSQIQITFTLRAKDQFSKARGRKTRRRRRGRGDGRPWREAGSGRTGGSGRGARSPRSWRGREGSGRRAGGRPETRQRFMGREGAMAAPRRPAGRSGHVTRPGPRRPPSLAADALTRPGGGPEVMMTRAGTGAPAARALWRPSPGEGEQRLRGRGLSFPRVISRPPRSPPALEGPGPGCAALRPAGPSLSAPGPSQRSCGPSALPHPPGLRALDRSWPCEPGPHPHSPLGPSTSRDMTLCQGEATLGGKPNEPCCPPPPPCE